ncbi:MAG: methyltransferase [Deltaproteobacteria bacterium]|nr:methyltransferase [Deltaproteobacteria bacterium]
MTRDSIGRGRVVVFQSQRGYRFTVDSVLLANFAIERLREMAIEQPNIAELGVGSGVVAIWMAIGAQSASVTGIEIQPTLVRLARAGVKANGLAARVKIVSGDLRAIPSSRFSVFPAASFDLVVTNPPYHRVAAGRVSPNTERAIARHEVHATIDDTIAAARHLLAPNGRLVIVYPSAGRSRLNAALDRHGLSASATREIRARAELPPRFILVEASAGGVERALPPVTLFESPGVYTRTADSILTQGPA